MNLGLPYKGSKNTIAEDIVKCLPRGGKLLDACCGGGAVLMAAAMSNRWEKILSQFIMDRLGPMNEELNVLRNFANAVDTRLEKAERTAKEQDNHHYYKLFAEQVKVLLEKL